ncbi:DNA-binding transcriptional regulator, LysR family [Sphingomonas gellani]|uniref:DNA-binding transcriptional regulator, LysR family n=1 Tax=Sphingomonas gellani TaxID=1166340 RepID=A0A1H8GTJ0_9SPHN|nr:LysR family transcriptional regulator [Sphingomonas gellani]SEN47441.1 DNA-binding transcriptional regulator, LysR family [Sphingomonas gellani]
MLDDLNELRTFQQVLAHGSLTGAARAMGVSLAVVSKRLATLEKRTGVRLVNRTTRNLSPTEEGEQLLVEVDRALEAIAQGEELLATGRDEPVGTLRVSAPVSFGRRHVAPVLGQLTQRYPQLAVSLSLDDRLADVTGGAIDVAIRIGGLAAAGGAAMRKLADNRRILLAAPAYLHRRGRPRSPDDLSDHDLLRYGDAVVAWRLFDADGREQSVPAPARLRVDNGDAVHDWCVAGLGITLKSQVDVAADLRAGTLEHVLPEWHAGDTPIVALFPDRATMPRKTRVFLDAMLSALSQL